MTGTIRTIKLAILLLSLAISASAQSAAAKPSQPDAAAPAAKPDAKLHADILKLFEVGGVRQSMADNLKSNIENGKKKMMEVCSACAPEFGDEWAKRMLARTKVDDFVDVSVRVYEKYFNDADVLEMIEMATARKSGQQKAPSPELKQKITEVFPAAQSEILGACAQIGAKLGAEIGMEIEKEHPEWVPKTAPADAPK